MFRKGVLLAVVALLSTTSLVHAQGTSLFSATQDNIGVTWGATYLSRYIWYGIDLFSDNHSAVQPFVSLDLWGTGWVFDTRWTRPCSSDNEVWEQIDYTLSYGGTCNEGSPCVTNWRAGWRYYNHPDGPIRHSDGCTQDLDRQELFATFAWPEIAPCGVVPSYTLVYVWPDESGRKSNGCSTHDGNSYWRQAEGFVHVFGLAKEIPASCCLAGPDQKIKLSADAVYNAGMGGRNVDHDWSHINWGIQTDINVNDTTIFTPGFVYQTTMDKSVNTSDEYWFFLMLTFLSK